ncbi:hypothetical protein ACFV27_08835 [Streptomyces antimycoticus]|uniref:Uncharacterized protein n=1 Tax=Streptomyces antimycoticus TaxID=68175 RepID=A0ABD5J5Z7_9ACTN|nr:MULTISPECIES: hypothetical protein [Streptomyces]MEE4583793.1 hypothetical protein [Streptomyces sp. DSM 41602]QTI89075.1 hypothetical protein AS97_51535 [Streptomyces sp. AgN23]WJD98010.1 hypothetical protein QR300_19540 [Streptomyces antimycoticus]WTA83196.1 hypothetical protein OG751_26770 [Streptomyces antimycoticus]WTB06325.1 hypothetical protein OG546_20140 [Streptomyces antimycoticus]
MRLTVYTIEGLEARMLELRDLANRSRAAHATDRPVSRAARRAAVVAARSARTRRRWTR